MTRIFIFLALTAMALVAANIVLGLWIGDYNGQAQRVAAETEPLKAERQQLLRQSSRPQGRLEQVDLRLAELYSQLDPIRTRATVHMLFGLAAALVTLLVNSISVTYFIGTSRWVREVVEAYDLSEQYIVESNRLKRRTFPWALGGMLIVVAIAALGNAANPGTVRAGTQDWVLVHYLGALLGTALIGVSFLVQYNRIADNYRIIENVLGEVQVIRQQRGLDTTS